MFSQNVTVLVIIILIFNVFISSKVQFKVKQQYTISIIITMLFFQDEVADLKASKDVSHSTLEDLDTEDLYVKLKVYNLLFNIFLGSHKYDITSTIVQFLFVIIA